jgi:hypothetical protein
MALPDSSLSMGYKEGSADDALGVSCRRNAGPPLRASGNISPRCQAQPMAMVNKPAAGDAVAIVLIQYVGLGNTNCD